MADVLPIVIGVLFGLVAPLPSTVLWYRRNAVLAHMREEPPRDRYFLRVNGREIEVV